LEMYIGKTCPHCQQSLKYDDAVVKCSDCGRFQHQNCWDENQGCITDRCFGEAIKVSGVSVGRDISPPQSSVKIFCSKCGTENKKSSSFCTRCGSSLGMTVNTYASNSYSNSYSSNYNDSYSSDEGLDSGEKAGICIGNICLSPILGVVLYFVWKNDKPKKADDVCGVTIFSVVAAFILSLIFGVFRSM
jgi:hypothetical protein